MYHKKCRCKASLLSLTGQFWKLTEILHVIFFLNVLLIVKILKKYNLIWIMSLIITLIFNVQLQAGFFIWVLWMANLRPKYQTIMNFLFNCHTITRKNGVLSCHFVKIAMWQCFTNFILYYPVLVPSVLAACVEFCYDWLFVIWWGNQKNISIFCCTYYVFLFMF